MFYALQATSYFYVHLILSLNKILNHNKEYVLVIYICLFFC